VRPRLHAVYADGRLQVGADCAIAIWQLAPRDAWLARLVGLPPIRAVARLVYDRFADLLYAWSRSKDIGERMYERGRPAFSAFKRALPASCRAPFFPARFRRTCTGRRAWMSFH
jgi:hypothetical protein